MTATEVGFSGIVAIQNDSFWGDRKLRIRRMEASQLGVFLERNNNMFLWMEDAKELYYQNPLGEKFRVLFEPV